MHTLHDSSDFRRGIWPAKSFWNLGLETVSANKGRLQTCGVLLRFARSSTPASLNITSVSPNNVPVSVFTVTCSYQWWLFGNCVTTQLTFVHICKSAVYIFHTPVSNGNKWNIFGYVRDIIKNLLTTMTRYDQVISGFRSSQSLIFLPKLFWMNRPHCTPSVLSRHV